MNPRCSLLLVLLLSLMTATVTCLTVLQPSFYGWSTTSSTSSASFQQPLSRRCRRRRCVSSGRTPTISLVVAYSSSNDDDDDDNGLHRRRISIAGASVSSSTTGGRGGFWIIFQVENDDDDDDDGDDFNNNNNQYYWPVQVTASADDDKTCATSLEALTLLQLLSGVDMAGPILPPERLSQLAVLHAETTEITESDDDNNDDIIQALLQCISLPNSGSKDDNDGLVYSELNEWQKSRIRLPQVTLDNVLVDISCDETSTIVKWTLVCQCSKIAASTFHFTPRLGLCQQENNEDGDEANNNNNDETENVALAFTSIALALRYQASLILRWQERDSPTAKLTTPPVFRSMDDIRRDFPLYQSVQDLIMPSQRVQSNVAKGFEIHKLTSALRIAMERGDVKAAASIRQRLDEVDTMDDLPISPQFEMSDLDQLQ